MEFIRGTNLKTYLVNRTLMPPKAIVAGLRGYLHAIIHLHNSAVFHRDIKSDNIVVSRDPGGRFKFTIIDFGITLVQPLETVIQQQGNNAAFTQVGCRSHMDPLIVLLSQQGMAYDPAEADKYSLGVLLYEIFFGPPPEEFRGRFLDGHLQATNTFEDLFRTNGFEHAWFLRVVQLIKKLTSNCTPRPSLLHVLQVLEDLNPPEPVIHLPINAPTTTDAGSTTATAPGGPSLRSLFESARPERIQEKDIEPSVVFIGENVDREGKSIGPIVTSYDAEITVDRFARFFQSGEEYETRLYHSDGTFQSIQSDARLVDVLRVYRRTCLQFLWSRSGTPSISDTSASATSATSASSTNLIRKQVWTDAGRFSSRISQPCGLALFNQSLYAVQQGPQPCVRVYRLPDAVLEHEFGRGQLQQPIDIVICSVRSGGEASVFVSDFRCGSIWQFSTKGKLIREIKDAEIQHPGCMAASNKPGNMLIADYRGNDTQRVIVTLDLTGQPITQAGAPRFPALKYAGLAIVQQFVFALDMQNHCVLKFTMQGEQLQRWGKHGAASGEFILPHYITATSKHVFVTDQGNNRVQQFTLDGEFVCAFGSSLVLQCPSGIVVDPDSLRVWVANYTAEGWIHAFCTAPFSQELPQHAVYFASPSSSSSSSSSSPSSSSSSSSSSGFPSTLSKPILPIPSLVTYRPGSCNGSPSEAECCFHKNVTRQFREAIERSGRSVYRLVAGENLLPLIGGINAFKDEIVAQPTLHFYVQWNQGGSTGEKQYALRNEGEKGLFIIDRDGNNYPAEWGVEQSSGLGSGTNLSSNRRLIKATMAMDIDGMRAALDDAANPNARTHADEGLNEATPLIIAAWKGSPAAAKLLLGYGAMKNLKTSLGSTAADVAEQYVQNHHNHTLAQEIRDF